MITLCVPTFTESDLLLAPFWIAEQLVIMSLRDNAEAESTSIQSINEFAQNIKVLYSQQIEQANFDNRSISTCLHRFLMTFYEGLPNLVPNTALSALSRHLFILPVEPMIEWGRLVRYFLSVHDDLQAIINQSLPPTLIQDYVRLQFVATLGRFAEANTSYDHALVKQALDELLLLIQQDAKVTSENYWERFDSLPIKRSLLELQVAFSSLRFTASQARLFGLPSKLDQRLSGLIPNELYADSLTNWASIHELKRDALQAKLILEADKPSAVPDNPPLTAAIPFIMITPAEVDKLFVALSPYVAETQRDDLKRLLGGKSIEAKITIVGRPMKSWCYVFNQAFEAAHIANTKIDLMKWVAHWFNAYWGKALKEFTAAQLEDNFYKSSLPPKSKRILYKP